MLTGRIPFTHLTHPPVIKDEVTYNMNIRVRIISLSIIAMLAFCMFNVAAASTNKPMIAACDAYIKNATAQQPTTIAITAPTQATANASVYANGTLTAGGKGIAGAVVHLQWLDVTTGNWTTLSDVKTGDNGQFSVPVFLYFTAEYTFRVTYDGDSQYAQSVSNEVMVTVVK